MLSYRFKLILNIHFYIQWNRYFSVEGIKISGIKCHSTTVIENLHQSKTGASLNHVYNDTMNQDNFSDTSYVINMKLESINHKMVDNTTMSKDILCPCNRSKSTQNSNTTNPSSNSVRHEPSKKKSGLQSLLWKGGENNSNCSNQLHTNIVSQTNTLTPSTTTSKKKRRSRRKRKSSEKKNHNIKKIEILSSKKREEILEMRTQSVREVYDMRKTELDNVKSELIQKPCLSNNIRFSLRLNIAIDNFKDASRNLIDYQSKQRRASIQRFRVPRNRCRITNRNVLIETKYSKPDEYLSSLRNNRTKRTCTKSSNTSNFNDSDIYSSDYNESDSDSSDSDSDFDPRNEQASSQQRHIKKETKNNEPNKYVKYNIHSPVLSANNEELETFRPCSKHDEQYTHSNKWVYDLKEKDPSTETFRMKSLIIIVGDHNRISSKTLLQMKNMSLSLSTIISEVIMIRRCICGQLYIVNGLHNSLHFSLGQNGCKELQELLLRNGITIRHCNETALLKDKKKDIDSLPTKFYVENVLHEKTTLLQTEYIMLMKDMGSFLWSTLLKVSVIFLSDSFFLFQQTIVLTPNIID